METTEARNLYMHTRQAECLAAQYRAGTIERTTEWRLLDSVEYIAKATDRASRVIWLEIVDLDDNAERTFAAEHAEMEQILADRAAAAERRSRLRQRALDALYPEKVR